MEKLKPTLNYDENGSICSLHTRSHCFLFENKCRSRTLLLQYLQKHNISTAVFAKAQHYYCSIRKSKSFHSITQRCPADLFWFCLFGRWSCKLVFQQWLRQKKTSWLKFLWPVTVIMLIWAQKFKSSLTSDRDYESCRLIWAQTVMFEWYLTAIPIIIEGHETAFNGYADSSVFAHSCPPWSFLFVPSPSISLAQPQGVMVHMIFFLKHIPTTFFLRHGRWSHFVLTSTFTVLAKANNYACNCLPIFDFTPSSGVPNTNKPRHVPHSRVSPSEGHWGNPKKVSFQCIQSTCDQAMPYIYMLLYTHAITKTATRPQEHSQATWLSSKGLLSWPDTLTLEKN